MLPARVLPARLECSTPAAISTPCCNSPPPACAPPARPRRSRQSCLIWTWRYHARREAHARHHVTCTLTAAVVLPDAGNARRTYARRARRTCGLPGHVRASGCRGMRRCSPNHAAALSQSTRPNAPTCHIRGRAACERKTTHQNAPRPASAKHPVCAGGSDGAGSPSSALFACGASAVPAAPAGIVAPPVRTLRERLLRLGSAPRDAPGQLEAWKTFVRKEFEDSLPFERSWFDNIQVPPHAPPAHTPRACLPRSVTRYARPRTAAAFEGQKGEDIAPGCASTPEGSWIARRASRHLRAELGPARGPVAFLWLLPGNVPPPPCLRLSPSPSTRSSRAHSPVCVVLLAAGKG